ncbi:MAG: patatin-like phospholipase family protein [Ginsengibacter sp.]
MKNFFGVLLALVICMFCNGQPVYKNLVMEGGGVRGLAYAGALEVLEQRGILEEIENVGGSSAGAIAGLLVVLNYSSSEIDSILQSLRIQEFNDGKFLFGKIKRIKKQFGLYKGDKIQLWLSGLIAAKTEQPDLTFLQLHELHLKNKNFKDLYVTGTNITQQRTEAFSWKTKPGMKLSTAVHISSCIPFYFVPVAIDSAGTEVDPEKSNKSFNLFVDGGMLDNYPISLFDSSEMGTNPLTAEKVFYNPETLGLKLEREAQVKNFDENNTAIAPYRISSMKEYTSAVMNLMMEGLNRKSYHLKNEMGRTIYISYGDISGRPRKMSTAEKKILHDNGVKAAIDFFENKKQEVMSK